MRNAETSDLKTEVFEFLRPYTISFLLDLRVFLSSDQQSSYQHPVSRIQYRETSLTAFRATAGCGLLALNPGLDDIGSAADSRGDTDGTGRTILGAGAAFHASIRVSDFSFFTVHLKHGMGTDEFTHTAAHTRLQIKLQRRYPF
jgi:hypothetical protein